MGVLAFSRKRVERDFYGHSLVAMAIDNDIGNFNPVDKTDRLYTTVFHPASVFPKDNSCSGLHCGGLYY